MDDDSFEPEVHDAVLAALDQLSDIVTSQVGTKAANGFLEGPTLTPRVQSGEVDRRSEPSLFPDDATSAVPISDTGPRATLSPALRGPC